jgi:hypothetical protein
VGLQGGVGHPGGVLRRGQLGDGGLGGDVTPGVEEPGRAHRDQVRDVRPRRHVGKAEGHRLVIDDRAAELLALLRVPDRRVQCRPRQPRGPGADEDPGGVEGAHEAVEALPFTAEAVLHRHPHPVQEDLGVDDAALTELAHRSADRHPGGIPVHHEGRDPAGALRRVDGREHHDPPGIRSVGDPGLLPGEDVVVPVAFGPCLQAGGVRPDLGLGDGNRRHRRPVAGQRAEVPLALLLVAQGLDRTGEEGAGGEEVADADVAVTELLLHQALRHQVGDSPTAVLRRQHVRRQADGCGLLPQVERRFDVGLVDGAGPWPDLPLGEVAGQRDEFPLYFGELDAVTDESHCCWIS